jgi:hypothetical protein
MPSQAETSGDSSLETQIIDIFIQIRDTLSSGDHLSILHENSRITELAKAVGELPVSALAQLIAGERLAESKDLSAVRASATLWSEEEQARKLRTLAYAAYCEVKDNEVTEFLAGKKITVTTRENPGGLGSAISRSNGMSITSGDSPGTVSGTFYLADTNIGNIILSADEPTDEIKYWQVSLIDSMTGEQRADIEIES